MGSDDAGIDGNNLHLRRRIFQVPQGISADLIATLEGLGREDLDRFALLSQQRAEEAQKEGWFTRSLVPVKDPETGALLLETDEHPRAGTTMEALSHLKPSFEQMGAAPAGPNGETLDQIALARYPEAKAIGHVHTAGNSSGIVDGAAAVLLASAEYVKAHGLRPRARIRAMTTIGAEPLIMLTAPAPASKRALDQAGMQVGDIDLWEINEAFATVPLQTIRKLEHRSRARQRGRRRHRPRPSPGRDRRLPGRHRPRRARAPRPRHGPRHAVHRRRHGHRHHRRARLIDSAQE